MRAGGTDGGEIVADTAAAPHGLGGLLQGIVDAGLAVADAGNGVAHRLHETIDEGGLNLQPGGGVDAAGGDETMFLRQKESFLPLRALFRFLGLGQTARDATTHVLYRFFILFRVFFQQDFGADLLRRHAGSLGGVARQIAGEFFQEFLPGEGFLVGGGWG